MSAPLDFLNILTTLEGELPPWRISYRHVYGAPLEAEHMKHGWTSHLSIWDSAASVEHKVDLFVEAALLEVAKVGGASSAEIAQVLPPVDELLP